MAASGIAAIVLGLASSLGLIMFMDFPFVSMHGIMMYLILGVGIDDMFVLVQCLENIRAERPDLSVEEKIGLTMRTAGLSITVTSLTDFIAFGLGGITVS